MWQFWGNTQRRMKVSFALYPLKTNQSHLNTGRRHQNVFPGFSPFTAGWRNHTFPALQDLEGLHGVRDIADQENWEKQVELLALQPKNFAWRSAIGRKSRLGVEQEVCELSYLEEKTAGLGFYMVRFYRDWMYYRTMALQKQGQVYWWFIWQWLWTTIGKFSSGKQKTCILYISLEA